MSLRRNIVANYVGQLYAALISILFVPFYIRYMGIEAYGLVGFYAMLQGWFIVLDMGLTPTVTRETARFNAGAISALELRQLFRALEGIFAATAFIAALALIAVSGLVAERWLHVESNSTSEVQRALCMMAVVVSLRWVCGLYRSAITGFEQLVLLSGFSIVVATLRFALVVPFLIYVGATPSYFFGYQLVIAVLEAAVLIGCTYRLLPAVTGGGFIRWQWRPVRRVLRFALSAAFTSLVWVLVSQTDKLILSGMISLTDYAYFTLAVLVASGITVLSGPIAAAILPRLTSLSAQGKEAALAGLYRDSTQIISVISVPIVVMLTLFPEQVLTAWTNQPLLAHEVAPVLALYSIGNGVLALAAFPYYLQVARGELSMHVVYNVIFVLLFVPLLFFAVARFGVIGAGYAWIGANLLPFLAWLPLVHRRYLPGMHLRWLSRDIIATVVLPILAGLLLRSMIPWSSARGWLLLELVLVYATLATLAAGSSSSIMRRLPLKIGHSAVLTYFRRSRI